MSIETTVYSVLSADAGVRALVSTGSPLVHRIYPQRVPDNAAEPFIRYSVVSATAYNKLGSAPDLERKRVQFNCISNDYDEALSVAEAIKRALEDENGYMLGEGQDFFEDTQRYRVRLDWSLIG